MSIEFTAAILCDQVRQENNGKYFVIGIYSANVVLGAFPAIAQFQLFARARMETVGNHKLAIRVMVAGFENQKFEADVAVSQSSEDWIPLALQPIHFQVPGLMSVEQVGPDGEWVEFFRINVTRPPTSLPLQP